MQAHERYFFCVSSTCWLNGLEGSFILAFKLFLLHLLPGLYHFTTDPLSRGFFLVFWRLFYWLWNFSAIEFFFIGRFLWSIDRHENFIAELRKYILSLVDWLLLLWFVVLEYSMICSLTLKLSSSHQFAFFHFSALSRYRIVIANKIKRIRCL